MEQLVLRDGNDADIPSLVAVIHAAFEEYRGRLDPPSGAHVESAETLHDKLKTTHAVVGLLGQEIIGCVFYELASEFVDLHRLAVLPPYRRQGVGRALVEFVERRAIALGVRRVRLGVRIPLNENRRYYGRMGYRFVKDVTHAGNTEPTVSLMEKDLSVTG